MARQDKAAFGRAVKFYREEDGQSQETLAELSHLHRTYISGVEHGKRNLGLVNVYKIARALRVSTASLFVMAETHRKLLKKHGWLTPPR